ncbi:hypothetical protein LTR10_009216 [Elasticomyces elasticus]|uniref:Uncharacterized protein n=1 Tax=Elasticomyces elasticus TaxID=574655 RepID=A0AAN7W6R5_9PEZI|nr:hypothetical protein LTR10_009216 [Elasticomyces elasticus]KAK4971684.1 hypothetical protein LTR42_007412 [Elasticomyces elasticus]KAK5695154.1 hypothetical protein LTR97_008660 [Elasticomyces elasticus]
MDESPFSRIPAELRNRCFELALCQPGPIQIHRPGDRFTATCITPFPTALLATCRVMRKDCTEMFYAVNSFSIPFGGLAPITNMPSQFLSQIGRKNTQAIRSMHVDLGEFNYVTDCANTFVELHELAESVIHIEVNACVHISLTRPDQYYTLDVRAGHLEASLKAHMKIIHEESALQDISPGRVDDLQWLLRNIQDALKYWQIDDISNHDSPLRLLPVPYGLVTVSEAV